MKAYQKLIYILSFVTINSTLFAQHVFPDYSDNAHWNVLECLWPECYTKSYNYEYDTIFCGQNYSKIHFTELNENGYFRSENLKTYFRKNPNCSDKEYLIYDYSLNIGDTVFVGYDLFWNAGKDTAEFVVDAIDTVNYFGVDRQRFKMLYDPMNEGMLYRPMYWINGIGSEVHPFYPFNCLWDGCEQGYQLLCYDSLAVQLYQNSWANTCDTTILGIPNLETDISIAPNPFSSEITVSVQNSSVYQINIYSSIGNKIMEYSYVGNNIIIMETDKLNSGSYILELLTNSGSYTKKIIKIE
jgi:hypothetical protein